MTIAPSPHEPGPAPDVAPPYVPPPPEGPRKEIASLAWTDPFRWLARGWADLWSNKGVALFYGLCFWSMAVVLALVFRSRPEYVMSIASGCLLVGPFLAMGLYDVSRRRELGGTGRHEGDALLRRHERGASLVERRDQPRLGDLRPWK